MVSSTSRPKRPPAGPPDEGPATRDAASTTVVTAPTPMVSAPELKKKDLIDRVVAASGVKKRDAKPAVEATLAVRCPRGATSTCRRLARRRLTTSRTRRTPGC